MAGDRPLVEESAVLVDGPWTHRDVNANGIRLHIAEAGTGPLVLLLHGFPEFWWCWRHQLVALADAGYHVVAPDLRGYGASDKPPRGYDAPTLAADVAGLVRAPRRARARRRRPRLGRAPRLVGRPRCTRPSSRKLAVLSIAHPLRMYEALLRDDAQRRASSYIARFQLPWAPERWLVADDAANVGALLHQLGRPGLPGQRDRAPVPRGDADPATCRTARWSTTDGRCDRCREPTAAATARAMADADHGADAAAAWRSSTRACCLDDGAGLRAAT